MDKVLFGLGVAALGMIVVFSGLIILIAFIKLLTTFTSRIGGKKKIKSQPVVVKQDEIPADVMAVIGAAVAASTQGVPADVVAAITAALNVVMGEGNFVVRRVKRINNAPAWNRAGREEQMYSRF